MRDLNATPVSLTQDSFAQLAASGGHKYEVTSSFGSESSGFLTEDAVEAFSGRVGLGLERQHGWMSQNGGLQLLLRETMKNLFLMQIPGPHPRCDSGYVGQICSVNKQLKGS